MCYEKLINLTIQVSHRSQSECNFLWLGRTRCKAPTQVCDPNKWRDAAAQSGCLSPSNNDQFVPNERPEKEM